MKTKNYLGQYGAETSGAMRVQSQTLAEAAAAEARLRPMLQYQQAQGLQTQAQNMLGTYGALMPDALRMQGQYAQGMLSQFGQMAPQATQAYMSGLPGYARSLSDLISQRAISDYRLGTALDPQQTAMAQQSARAAAAARGLTGNQAVGMEVLNSYKLGQERWRERQLQAQNAYTMGANQQQMGYSQFLSPAFQQSSSFGLPSLMNTAQASVGMLGPQFLQPESQYLANLRNQNIQMQMAQEAAKQQRRGAIIGGVTSMFGSMFGGLLGNQGLFGSPASSTTPDPNP